MVDVEAIRAASPIVEVIGEHVHLRSTGTQFVGLCPFHSEKTPSFVVNPAKQVFFCHGCHAGGDVFHFVGMRLHLSFREAAEYLAERAGIAAFDQSSTSEELRRAKAAGENEKRAAEALADAEFRAWLEAQTAVRRLEVVRRNAAKRLAAIHCGERERFAGETETAWLTLTDVYTRTPDAAATYYLVSFAAPPERFSFVLNAERRGEMVEAALERGYVTDGKGQRFEIALWAQADRRWLGSSTGS